MPKIGRFLVQDRYEDAQGDLTLQSDPLTQNRYAFAGGNPVNRIEWDGHISFGDVVHTGLDVAGLVPGVGEAADLAYAAIYAAEGNKTDAALSAAAAVPIAGWGATAAKGARKGAKAVEAEAWRATGR